MKTFHFLSGLPRTGNTVLSSILNQNPTIYSSPLSPVLGYAWSLYTRNLSDENVLRLEDKTGCDTVIKELLNNYYSNIDKPIIFDREKDWGTPANLRVLREAINPSPKIVYTVRPILEILASYMTFLPEDSYVDRHMVNMNWWNKPHLSKFDNRCDFLMRPQGDLDKSMTTLWEINKPENKDVFHIIEYDDLMTNPDETLNKLYGFLGIDSYKHNFSNIVKLEKDNEESAGFPSDMHKVRKKLSKKSIKPENILSDYILSKYSNLETWR